MKTTLLTLTALALFSHASIQAQEVKPRVRADVRAEAASAEKSGTLVKGEGPQASPPM